MNYFSKNLKTLRNEAQLSQVDFGLLFGLSKSNINSYENGIFPKLEMFIRIMDHFQLDPSKFIWLDMTLHHVYRSEVPVLPLENTSNDVINGDFDPMQGQFQNLRDYPIAQLIEMYQRVSQSREQLRQENGLLKDKYIALLETTLKPTL